MLPSGVAQWHGRAGHEADERTKVPPKHVGRRFFHLTAKGFSTSRPDNGSSLLVKGCCATGLCSIAHVVALGGLFSLLAGHGQSPSVKDVYQGCQTVIIVRRISLEEGHAEGKTNMLALQNIWRTLVRM